MIKLYDFTLSGNCYKVRLLLSLLKLEHELVPVDLRRGEHRSEANLKLNPFGQVPVLMDANVTLRDSQAILVYLARKYGGEDWLPTDAEAMSKVMQWLSTAANEIRRSFALARLFYLFKGQVDVEQAQREAYQFLEILNQHLLERDWLELNCPTIADIACFPYIALAANGKISLEPYPHVIAWIERIKQLPGFVGMPGL